MLFLVAETRGPGEQRVELLTRVSHRGHPGPGSVAWGDVGQDIAVVLGPGRKVVGADVLLPVELVALRSVLSEPRGKTPKPVWMPVEAGLASVAEK